MYVWSALLTCLAVLHVVTGRVFKEELAKTVENALSAETVVRSLSNPKYRSGAADCDLDIQRFLDALYRKELWAVKVLDSSSYFITGILHGNFAEFGNYDECLRAAPPGDGNQYFPLYSLVEILVEQKQNTTRIFKNNGMKWNVRENTLTAIRKAEEVDEWISIISLNLGICWIRSCGADAPGKAVAGILRLTDGALKNSGYRLRVSPPLSGADDVGLPPTLSRADWVVIIICVVILLMVLIGTLLDLEMLRNPARRGNPGWKAGFLAFSVYTNGRRLITVGPPAPDALTAISGLRVFSILWVMLGHRYRFMIDLPYTNKIVLLEEVKNWGKEIVLGGPLSVDTFFTIGGVLNCYVFFINMRKGQGFNVFQFFIHRYIRLTPALAIMVGIQATWFYYINSGPLWNKLAGDARSNCQNYWWTSLLYVSNYVNPNNQCLMQSWYLMADMQLHWFSILVLVPLWRWRKVGLAWLTFLIAVSCAIPFAIVFYKGYRTPLPTESFTKPGTIDNSMEYIYFPTHTRATSYLVGLLFGYYLYRARFVVRRFRIGMNFVIAGWALTTILTLVAIFAAYPLYQFDQEISIWSSAFYVGFYRLAWSLGIGWIVLACATGYGGPIHGLLSWAPFVVLARLVYGMYLTHAAVQMASAASIRGPDYYSDFTMVQRAFSDFALSTCFGAILCLGLESPITALEKMLLYRPRREPKERPAVQPEAPRLSSTVAGIDNPALDVEVNEELRQRPSQTHL